MKKVIYISHAHLSEKLVRDWYIGYLQSRGVTVEFWDLVPLLFGDIVEVNSIKRDFVFTPSSYGEIENHLQLHGNRDAIYVMLMNFEGRFRRIYRLMSKYNCRMFFMAWGAFPFKTAPKWLKLLRGLAHPAKLARIIFHKISAIIDIKLRLVKPFDVVFGAGYAISKAFPDAGKVVHTNLPDYDRYMAEKDKKVGTVEGDYAVFVDICLPFHPDNAIEGLAPIDPNRYFASLNHFFDILERKTGQKVVIAAHPQSDYDETTFNRRKIFKGCTEDLVRNAQMVISHHSTSTSYAVLNEKPVVFIYTNEIKQKRKHTLFSQIKDFADYLDAEIYNVDELSNGDQVNIRPINKTCYDKYKYDFLTTRESEHTSAQDIFWREVKNYG